MTTDAKDAGNPNTAEREAELLTLAGQMKSPSRFTRESAAKRLGELKGPADLLLPALRDRDAQVRYAAAWALGTAAPGDHLPDITEGLMAAIDDPGPRVCTAAIRSLGLLGVQAAHDQIAACLDDRDLSVVRASIVALGRLGQAQDVASLLPFLDSEHPFVVAAAVRALSGLGYGALAPWVEQRLRTILPSADAGQAEFELALSCIDALGRLRTESGADMLKEIALKHVGLRSQAVRALTEMGCRLDEAVLEVMINDPSERLRSAAVRMILQPGGPVDSATRQRFLRHKNAGVREAALRAVQRELDRESVEQVLWMCYHESNPYLRPLAVATLKDLLEDDSIQELTVIACDPNHLVSQAAVSALGSFTYLPIATLDVLTGLRQDPNVGAAVQQILAQFSSSAPHPSTGDAEANLSEHRHSPLVVPAAIAARRGELLAIFGEWQSALLSQKGGRVARLRGAISALIDTLQEGERTDDAGTMTIESHQGGKP